MKNIFYKITAISFLFSISSCYIFKDFNKDEEQAQVRFVSLEGQSRQIELKTPPQNIEALHNQGKLTNSRLESQPPVEMEEKTYVANKYSEIDQRNELEQTLSLPVGEKNINREENSKTNAFDNQKVLKEVEYDLSKDEVSNEEKTQIQTQEQPKKVVKKPTKTSSINHNIDKGYYAQAGSFASEDHAKDHIYKIKKLVPSSSRFNIQEAVIRQKKYHRVLIGPYKYKKNANSVVSNLDKKGEKAILIKVK